MADDNKTWVLIHAGRKDLADTLDELTAEQWATGSLCGGWTVGETAAHVLAGAEQTAGSFTRGMLGVGLRFDAMVRHDVSSRAALSQRQVIDRLRARTITTNRPPAPVMAMLGEIVVHSEDIRRPLGLPSRSDAEAANACLDMYTKASFPVGGKKRIAGLHLVTTDTGWSWGAGPEVRGPAMSVLLAMTGRAAGLADLSGDGAALLSERLGQPASSLA